MLTQLRICRVSPTTPLSYLSIPSSHYLRLTTRVREISLEGEVALGSMFTPMGQHTKATGLKIRGKAQESSPSLTTNQSTEVCGTQILGMARARWSSKTEAASSESGSMTAKTD